jgi:3D (Asp-Asp-Asp) domain-containing protein
MDTLKTLCVGIVLSAMLTIIAFLAAYKTLQISSLQAAENPSVEIDKAEAEIEEIVAKPEKRYLGRYKITGYDTCAKCCGKEDGITASGLLATVGRTCAAPESIPFGTKLFIEGIGERIVEDRGGFDDNVIDVLCENHVDCYALTGYYDVYVMEGDQDADVV